MTDFELFILRMRFHINMCGANSFLFSYSSLRAKLKLGDDCMLHWMTIDDCKETFKDIVDGLAYIHDKGVMHGDISTDNILYRDGVAKITDFGLG